MSTVGTVKLNIAMDSLTAVPAVKEKPKRKNSEKRKEKSRKAARERRSQESKIFDQIEDILPVSSKTLEHLDKASLVRVAINYLKIRSVVDPLKAPSFKDAFDEAECSASNTLNGFVFVLSKDGDLVYLSDNVERHLGLSSIDLLGQSIYDFSHPCDHDDIKLFLEPLVSACNGAKFLPKAAERPVVPASAVMGESTGPFFIRMKCTLTNKGRNCNLKSAIFKVVKCTGRMVDLETADPLKAALLGDNFRQYMVAVGELIPHPCRIEAPLQTDVFMSKHSPDLKFTYADESIEQLFGFNANDLIGTSFYKYFDASDFKLMNDFFKTLFAKGQCDSGFYKLLVKTGGYRWISTQATVITEPNSNQPQSIILVNRVISGVENAHCITSDVQEASKDKAETSAIVSCAASFEAVSLCPVPISATASVIQHKQPNGSAAHFQVLGKETATPAPVPLLTAAAVVAATTSDSSGGGEGSENHSDRIQENNSAEEQQAQLNQYISEPISVTESILAPISATENCISSTATVLAPKTADMESGFLMFTDDNTGMTVLTDADDLTHLAPDAGDLCVPMLSDMDMLNDLNLFDDIFLNSTSSNMLQEDELLNNLANGFESTDDKMKVDGFDSCLGLEAEGSAGSGTNLAKYDSNSMLAMSTKDLQYSLANDPFLYQNDDVLMSTSPPSTTPSSGSLSDRYSSLSNSPSDHSPSASHFSPKLSCGSDGHHQDGCAGNGNGDLSLEQNLCDTTDFEVDRDLEMRAPFIPIDDDFLLNDFAYSDSNMDDLFSWISGGSGYTGGRYNSADDLQSFGDLNMSGKACTSGSSPIAVPGRNGNGSGGCLEALLQNDELLCNLKNRMYNSDQLLNQTGGKGGNVGQMTGSENGCQVVAGGQASAQPAAVMEAPAKTTSSPIKRKNSNILIYATVNGTDGKKFKNLVLSTSDNLGNLGAAVKAVNGGADKSTVHHFVLTKNNELVKSNFGSHLPFKVSSKRFLPMDSTSAHGASLSSPNANSDDLLSKEDLLFKKARQEPDKQCYSANSVLLNLLVNGADLPNGYEIGHQ